MRTALDALAESMANKEKIEQEKKMKSADNHTKFLMERQAHDDQWIEKCKHNGEHIIDLMVENGVPAGRKYKMNKYYGGIFDVKYGHPTYKFDDIVTREAIESVIKYFNNLGYGCEIEEASIDNRWLMDTYHEQGLIESIYYDIVEKQRFGWYKTTPGTMYLWFIDPDETEEQTYQNHNGEICW